MSPHDRETLTRLLKTAKVKETEIEAFVVTITPELAIALLQNNVNIRRLRESGITRYMADMLLGGWAMTGEPLIFDLNGNLRDGQHRLHACQRSGVPFTTVVVTGIPVNADLSAGSGMKRSFDDYLRNHDYEDAKNLATTIRRSYQLVEEGEVSQNATYTNETLIRWFQAGHESVVQDLEIVRPLESRWPKGFTRNHAASIRHAAGFIPGVDIEEVDAFFRSLAYDQETIQTNSPPHVLHTAFAKSAAKGNGRVQIPVRMALTIKALNLYLTGQPVPKSGITWRRGGKNPEAFPQISAGVMAEVAAEMEAEGDKG